MHLQQDTHLALDLLRLAVDGLQQAEAIDRMDEVHKRYNLLDLVGLQMADEMPADVFGQGFVLRQQLLYAALAKIAFPCLVGLDDGLVGVELADANHGHTLWDVLADSGYMWANSGHGLLVVGCIGAAVYLKDR